METINKKKIKIKFIAIQLQKPQNIIKPDK